MKSIHRLDHVYGEQHSNRQCLRRGTRASWRRNWKLGSVFFLSSKISNPFWSMLRCGLISTSPHSARHCVPFDDRRRIIVKERRSIHGSDCLLNVSAEYVPFFVAVIERRCLTSHFIENTSNVLRTEVWSHTDDRRSHRRLNNFSKNKKHSIRSIVDSSIFSNDLDLYWNSPIEKKLSPPARICCCAGLIAVPIFGFRISFGFQFW